MLEEEAGVMRNAMTTRAPAVLITLPEVMPLVLKRTG